MSAGGVALYMYSRRFAPLPETGYFQAIILLTTGWSSLQAIDVLVTDFDAKVLLMELKFIFAPFICVAVYGLFTSLEGRGSPLTRRGLVLISVVPVITVLMALTSHWHSWFLYDLHLTGDGPVVLHAAEGIWYKFYLLYSYALMVVALIVILDSARGANLLYKKQVATIGLAYVPPFLSDVVQNYLLPFEDLDLAPATFIASGVIIGWGLYHYRILDIRPIARGEVVDNMTDAMLVVDLQERVIDLNRSAEPLLAVPPPKALGTPIAEALRSGDDIATLLGSGAPRGEVTVGRGIGCRTFDASVMPVEVGGELRARMVLMRDVTDRERAEGALRAANSRLDILSSLTRHDLLNRLAVIDGYLALAAKEKDPEKLRRYLEKMERSSDAARMLIKFAGDYQSVGIKAPAWLRVDEVFARAAAQHRPDNVEVVVRAGGLSIYADAMLEKVFYNLIDNTVRHGGAVTAITLDYEEHGDRLSLIYRDNGIGVPGKDKPLIFLREFGVNTGLGLFLAREVLAITGIEIVENGDEGRGARFEMTVPGGGYRIEPRSPAAPRAAAGSVLQVPTSFYPPSSPTTR